MAKEAGADAAKFQHFKAETIVSKKTFDNMDNKLSHQKKNGPNLFLMFIKRCFDKMGLDRKISESVQKSKN